MKICLGAPTILSYVEVWKPMYFQFAAELNLKLKPQENNIEISPISNRVRCHSSSKYMKFQLILRCLA
jgi:hypothetical protein